MEKFAKVKRMYFIDDETGEKIEIDLKTETKEKIIFTAIFKKLE